MSQFKMYVFQRGELVEELELNVQNEYIAGRQEECDIKLDSDGGVSRQHFKLYFNGELWCVEQLSRFGRLSFLGASVESLELRSQQSFGVASYEFRLEEEAIATSEEEIPSIDAEEEVAGGSAFQAPAPAAAAPMVPAPMGNDFAGDDEKTKVSSAVAGDPYIKIVNEGAPEAEKEQVIRLEGSLWRAGRENSSEIVLSAKGVSRRQFEMARTSEGFFITDLNSSNGTLLNGQKLMPDQPYPLRSGDVITTLSINIYFELRDSSFQEKWALVPSDMTALPMETLPLAVPQNAVAPQTPMPYDPYGGGVPQQSRGVIARREESPVEQAMAKLPGPLQKIPGLKGFDWKKNKARVALVSVLLVVCGFLFSGDPKPTKSASRQPANETHQAFQQLSSEEQTLIKDTYSLAKSLYLQKKYDLALAEIQRIHQLVPFYEDSKQLEVDCRQFKEIRLQQAYISRQKQAALDLERKVSAQVIECEQQMTPRTTIEQLNTCLGDVLDLNPDHPDIQRMRAQIEEREAEKARLAAEKRARTQKLRRAKGLYQKAFQLEQQGRDHAALQAYQRFLNSGLPKPRGLKNKASRSIASIRSNMDNKIAEAISNAQSEFRRKAYKKAMDTLKAALKINPGSAEIQEKMEEFLRMITKQMKVVYQDSVLEESLGNVDAAKEKWRQIINNSIPADPYYNKARNKLKKYEGV